MTSLDSINALPTGNVANSSPAPSKVDASVRSTAPAKDSGKSDAAGVAAANNQASQDKTLVANAVEEVKKAVATTASNLQFSIDDDTGKTVVKIVDEASQQVIRQIPSKEMLELAKALGEGCGSKSGLLLKNEA